MNTVRNLNDVVNFVYWLGRPAMIKDVEIESIQQFMGEYVHAEVEDARQPQRNGAHHQYARF